MIIQRRIFKIPDTQHFEHWVLEIDDEFVHLRRLLFGVALAKLLFDPALLAYLGDRTRYAQRGLVIALSEIGWSGATLAGIPLLGVCLGHQAIGEAYGAAVVSAPEIVHGKPSLVHHDELGVYAGLPSPLVCARYHSLVIDPATLPDELQATAHTASGVLMGVRHRTHPVEGVQMHPESILTTHGHEMLQNFLSQ